MFSRTKWILIVGARDFKFEICDAADAADDSPGTWVAVILPGTVGSDLGREIPESEISTSGFEIVEANSSRIGRATPAASNPWPLVKRTSTTKPSLSGGASDSDEVAEGCDATPTNHPCVRKPLISVAVPVLPKVKTGRE